MGATGEGEGESELMALAKWVWQADLEGIRAELHLLRRQLDGLLLQAPAGEKVPAVQPARPAQEIEPPAPACTRCGKSTDARYKRRDLCAGCEAHYCEHVRYRRRRGREPLSEAEYFLQKTRRGWTATR